MKVRGLKALPFLFVGLIACIALWLHTHKLRTEWLNVSPPLSVAATLVNTLGDRQFAYRVYGQQFQTEGDLNGRKNAFRDYNYNDLMEWAFVLDKLDPASNYVPYLAAYYYGATPETAQLAPVIFYLAQTGGKGMDEKWRWLAHSILLAKRVKGDVSKAFVLSTLLARMPYEIPVWARQMPAVIADTPAKRAWAAYTLGQIVDFYAYRLHPVEREFTREILCDQVQAHMINRHPWCLDRGAG